MRASFAATLASLAVAAGFGGCQGPAPGGRTALSSIPPLDPAVAEEAGLSSEGMAGARKLYIAKCARCHQFYDPASYDIAEWRMWMTKMSKKAHLKTEQKELLARYLAAFREVPARKDRR